MAAKRPVLIALAVLVAAGGAVAAAVVLKSSSALPTVATGCGRSVSGQGFRVFTCMSGGALAGHPHPKELLVVRDDGSSSAYPVFRTAELAAAGREVVATYDLGLVRVTTSGLVPLLTQDELAKALRVRSNAILDVHDPKIDEHGRISFVPSVLAHPGCRNPLLEFTAAGVVRRIAPSTSPICS